MENEIIDDEQILDDLEKRQEEEEDFDETPPGDIVAYNELRSCADLFRLYDEEQLDIQPAFQRDKVWKNPMQTRFVDSLVKQLPIPSMCISLDYKTQERLVIDGLQRISSVIQFLDQENEWKLSNLDDVDSRISGKTNLSIKKRYSDIFNKVQNTVVPVTVLRCDYSKKSHMNYLFTIFHRLNTGGTKLNNQEIRNCIYNGTFNSFLKEAVSYQNFISLFGIEEERTYRFSYQELILRFLAFSEKFEKYNGKLAKFLNEFMDDNQHVNEEKISEYRQLFQRSIDQIYHKVADNNRLVKLSKATTEGIFVGVARNIEQLKNESDDQLKQKFQKLREDENFSIDNLKEGLSQKEKVINRLQRAVEIFAE